MRGFWRQGLRDDFQHPIHVSHDVIIPETQCPIAARSKPAITNNISFAFRVLSTVNFDNQHVLAAHEVSYIGANRLLTDKFVAVDAA